MHASSTNHDSWYLLDSMADPVVVADVDGTIVFVNRAAERALSARCEVRAGRNLLAMESPGEHAAVPLAEYLRLCARNRDPVVGILRLNCNGQTAVFRCEGSAVRQRGSHQRQSPPRVLLRLLAQPLAVRRFLDLNQRLFDLSREIRRRVAAEHGLMAQREWLQVTLSSIGDAVIATDAAGRITFLNPVAEALTGWPEDQAIGQPLEQVFCILNEYTRQPAEHPLERVLREGVVVGLANHTILIARDGREIPIDDSAAPIRMVHGQIAGAVLVFHDVSQQRRVERWAQFLAAASASLAAVTDYQQTVDSVVQLVVPFLADWAALDLADAGGGVGRAASAHADRLDAAAVQRLEARHPPRFNAPLGPGETVRSGQPRLEKCLPPDAPAPAAADSCLCVPLAVHQQTIGALTLVRVGPRAAFDQPDVDGALELARRAAVAIENARLYRQLREADQLKNNFLAMLGHELRNPLAPIRNAAAILGTSDLDEDTLRFVRTTIERQVDSMVRLVEDLLDVSRISRGKIQLRRERVDCSVVISRAIETARPLIHELQHELLVSLPREPVVLQCDPMRITQVVSNLLSNAAKYTDHGGRIWLAVYRENDDLVIRVKDNGVGIPAQSLPHIFELFNQVDRSLHRAQGGLGIGLTIVRSIVEMHGGSIHAFSDGPGQGSEFVVRLPLHAGDTEDAADSAAGQPGTPPPRRVLVVDDNFDAARSLRIMLRKVWGHEVEVCYDGLAAIEMAQQWQPDIVLLDIGLPKLDGYEVARRLRAQPAFQHTLLVAMTGYGQDEDRRRSYEAGFDHHLVKPVDVKALERLLSALGQG